LALYYEVKKLYIFFGEFILYFSKKPGHFTLVSRMGTFLWAHGSATHQTVISYKVTAITVGFPWKNMAFHIRPFIMHGNGRRMWLDVDFCWIPTINWPFSSL
jgi:hypothetical protein